MPKFSTNYHLFSFFNSEGKELCRSFFRPEASISVTQKINQATKWIHTFSLTNQSLSLQPTFSQPVMISPRVILRNDVFPDLQKTVVFHSILIYHNLFRQQIAQIDFQYLYQDKTTISSMGIDERFIRSKIATDQPHDTAR